MRVSQHEGERAHLTRMALFKSPGKAQRAAQVVQHRIPLVCGGEGIPHLEENDAQREAVHFAIVLRVHGFLAAPFLLRRGVEECPHASGEVYIGGDLSGTRLRTAAAFGRGHGCLRLRSGVVFLFADCHRPKRGQPEVADLHIAVRVDENIVRLEIPMNDALKRGRQMTRISSVFRATAPQLASENTLHYITLHRRPPFPASHL